MGTVLLVMAGVLLGADRSTGAEVPPLRGLSRTNLLETHTADGAVKTAGTAAEWEARKRRPWRHFSRWPEPSLRGE